MRLRSGLFSVFLLAMACNGDKPQSQTRPASSPEPIPSDLVFNSAFDDKGATPKITLALDSGAAAPGDATHATGSTAKLVDAGADPKAPMAYAFGTKTRTVTATIKVTAVGGPANAPDQPPLKFTFTATPKPKAMIGGDATIDIKVTKFELTLPPGTPPAQAAGKEQLEKSLVGVTGHFDATTHGDIDNIDFAIDKAAQGAQEIAGILQQAFEFLVVPIPNEPIGIGAKWTKTESKRLADQGTTVSSTVTLTLLARDAQTASIKVDATNSGTMAISDPRAPKGTAVQRSTTASYTVLVRLDGISQKVDGEAKNDITQKVPGQPDQSMSIKIGQSLESK